jgi:ABC-2 type transport system ATP-binding protein
MLEIHNVSHRYRHASTPALNDVSMTVTQGMCLGLLGPNGAGKTTLLSLLAGLQSVQAGQIMLNDIPLHRLTKRQSQTISLIPQDFAFYPLLSVWENMRFFASLYQVGDRRFLQSLLEQVDLFEYHRVLAKNLSGGLKRRLNFAIGLINSPSLIFMDEITVGVDPVSRQFILDAIKSLNQSGTTVIYTSHYLYEVEEICSKIAILEQGAIRYEGAVEAILRDNIDAKLSIKTKRTPPQALLDAFNGQRIGDNLFFAELTQPIAHILQQFTPYDVINVNYGHGSLESFYLSFLKHSAESCSAQGLSSC